jgi:tetratricopeptide (TPR) repeat protein
MKEKSKYMDVIKNMETLFKGNPVIFKLKAMNAVIEGNEKLADEYYSLAFKGMPKDKEIIVYLGKRYTDQKLWAKSIDHFKSVLSYYPNEPFFLQQLGDLYLHCPEKNLRDLKQAKYYSERAFYSVMTPKLTWIFAGKNLSEVYSMEKNWQKALTILNMTLNGAKVLNLPDKDIKDMQEKYSVIQKNLN